ncbi:MAG: hypothetical protein RLZZ461_1286, partial [Planctomycetota bacterium]
MSLLRAIWRRLDDLQHRMVTRIVLTVLAVVVVSAFFGTVWWTAADARDRFDSVVEVLRQVNRDAANPVTTRLIEDGQIEVDGRTYGGPRVKAGIDAFFDPGTGELLQTAEIAAIFIGET